eukprot:CAMPEP_0114512626 /NCGR_PEP_ID=MMETSP0109-20121206/15086_1 /TAXON_ID=29199 /ORGANISM="Chlorarachnion reptans, Strain CCCM449" /LENGTH=50 /DNA_ID=CAMNT_0001692343 /DNA_START=310 /DNA_END=462 /DNA_ORIENTATION=-
MTAIDSVKYAVGASDKLKGTGVWSFIEAERKPAEDDDKKNQKNKKPSRRD